MQNPLGKMAKQIITFQEDGLSEKKISLGLDLRSAATEEYACQVRSAPELREGISLS